jgi:predicted nucleotidyltransferase
MNIFLDAHRQVLQKLIDQNVEFILIGGYAVNYHGYNRTTGDMDIWLKPDNENKLKLLDALTLLDFDEAGINTIKKWNFETPQLFSILEKPFLTEFITHISGVKYTEALEQIIKAEIDGLIIPVIHVNNLIQNKKASGRLKDLADVEYLEKILELRKKHND